MKNKWFHFLYAVFAITFIASCGVESEGQTTGYKETKTMVLDILKSDDGIKAIKEAQQKNLSGSKSEGGSQEGSFKALSIDEQQRFKEAVKELLTDENNNKLLKQIMTDPKFAGEFAKAIAKENKKLQKELLKDPEYQQSMMQIMKNPDYEKMVLELLKSSQYKQQAMSTVQEAIKSPLFKLELMPLLQKVVSEEMKPKEDKGENKGEDKEKEGKKDSTQSEEDEGEEEGEDEGKKKDKELSKTS